MSSEEILELYGARLALIGGNTTECPLMVGVKRWTIEDEIAVAMVERKRSTVH